MSEDMKTERKMAKRIGRSKLPLDLVINHDLEVFDDEFLDPLEVRRRAIEDANASFDKFARELA